MFRRADVPLEVWISKFAGEYINMLKIEAHEEVNRWLLNGLDKGSWPDKRGDKGQKRLSLELNTWKLLDWKWHVKVLHLSIN